MKKINELSLPFKGLGLYFVALLLLITSCKKDNSDAGKLSKNELETLKDWQSKNFDQKSILFSGMIPNWNTIYVNQLKDKTVYEVELTSTDNAFMTNGFLNKDENNYQNASRFKLLIFKDAKTDKITEGYYMSSISNEPIHYTQTDQFTGYIYFYNTKGNFINGWSFDAGRAVQGIKSGTYVGYKETMNSSLKEKINMNNFGNGRIQVEAPGNTCYTMSFPVYATSCISVEDSPPICSIYIKGYVYGQFCPGVEISPDGSGGVVPDPITPIGQPPVVPTTPTLGPDDDPDADPLQAKNKLCASSFQFALVVAPGDGSRGWKEAAVAGLTINVTPSNYFENIWNSIATGSGSTVGTFNLTVGVPGDIPSANAARETGIAVNKAMVDIYRSHGAAGVKVLINTGQIGTAIAALAQIQLSAIIPGVRVGANLSNRVTAKEPVIGVNCQ